MTETTKQETIDGPPELKPPAPSGRLTLTLVSLAALAVAGAATANFVPNLESISLPSLDRVSLPKFDYPSLPNVSRIFPSNSSHAVAQSPPPPVPPPQPDFIARAALRDLQLSQEQNAAVLASLTQNSSSLQADLKRISRQISTLTMQVEGLRGSVAPLTTSSIPHSNPRARIIRAARKAPAATPPPPPSPALPSPVGPVSVGGAPLGPPPSSGV